jgi:hypothetical protein
MTVVAFTEASAASVGRLAVAIKAVRLPIADDSGQNHCGIVYRFGGRIKFCHLAWHHILENGDFPLDKRYYFANCGGADENHIVVAAKMELISRNVKSIPYAIDYVGCGFHEKTFDFLPPPDGKGLTCATFIMLVFASLGFPLLDEDTWPDRADDAKWQQFIIAALEDTARQGAADPAHVEAVKRDVGKVKRFRPEEVVAAATRDEWPGLYPDIALTARQIIADLQQAS